jgi:uncharacterized protein (TIGR02145 family)
MIDNRNGQEYTVRKLKDNKCWMIDNLKLELGKTDPDPTKDTTVLEPENTDVTETQTVSLATSGRADNSNFTTSGYLTKTGASSGGTNYDNYNAWRQVDPGSNNTTISDTQNCAPQGSKINCGYLYNFYTATASTTGNTQPTTHYVAKDSICPAGWKLPTGRIDNAANGDFQNLDVKYGGLGFYRNANLEAQGLWLSTGAWRGAFGGVYGSGLSDQGSIGNYWSSSNNHDSAYYTYFGSGYIDPGSFDAIKYYGLAVRCLVN